MSNQVNTVHVQIKHFYGNQDQITCATFSVDLQILITGSDDCIIRIFNVVSGKLIIELISHGAPLRSIAISDDSKLIASGDFNSRLLIFTLRTVTCKHDIKAHTKSVECVEFSPGVGRFLLSGSWDHTAVLSDSQSGEILIIFTNHINLVQSLAFSLDCKMIAIGSWDYSITIHDLKLELISKQYRNNKTSKDLVKKANVLKGHNGNVYCLAFSSQGILASGSWDKEIILWNTRTLRCIYILRGHEGWINSLSFSSDGLKLLSTSEDDTVRLWDCIGGMGLQVFQGRTDAVSKCTFREDSIIILGYNQFQVS